MKSKIQTVNILILNCGSSSLKYKIIRMPEATEIVRGEAERVGVKSEEKSVITHYVSGRKIVVETPMADHCAALKKALILIKNEAEDNIEARFDIFAHRYVHPGTLFKGVVKVNRVVLRKLKKTLPLAPIHNPVTYKLIEYCHREYSGVKQFVVFDTVFHKTIPPEYATYALPLRVIKKYRIKKIGFHGISHRYVMEETCKYLSRDKKSQKIISCHLGTGGSSVCAISGGRSLNSSMGFTPLKGLMMNTRCGNIDPGLIFYIMFKKQFSPQEAENIFNNKSGVLGVFNASSDLRDAIRHMKKSRNAKMAFDMYVRRARMYVSYYSLIMKKADILVFTDSLGTGSYLIRQAICEDLEFLGIKIDYKKNTGYRAGILDISSSSGTKVLIVPTDEEKMIARESYREMIKK